MLQEDLSILSPEAQEVYMAQVRIFESEEWKATVEWATEEHVKCVGRELASSKWDDILMLRGERRAYHRIMNLEETTEKEFESLVEQAKEMKLAEEETEHE